MIFRISSIGFFLWFFIINGWVLGRGKVYYGKYNDKLNFGLILEGSFFV